jgi:hypothetical protein
MALILRSVKGSPLTISEVDGNFTTLDTGKLDKTGGTSLYLGTGANSTRFPNALTVISNTAAGIQQNEPHNAGLVSEGTASSLTTTITGTSGATSIVVGSATGILIGQLITGTGIAPNASVTNIVGTTITVSIANTGTVSGTGTFSNIGVGVYGKGYASGAARSGGVVGEGHVSATGDTGSAIGVRGYANDTHAGGMNIGLYGDATGGATNYALYINRGGVFSTSSLDITAPSLGIPTGGTGARPGTPAAGYLRFNSDLTTFEGYNGSKWGSIGGGLTPTTIKTANGYTATSNDLVRCDTTSGAFSITFPTSPTDGDIIGVVDITGNFNTANLTINRGGTTTIESDTSLILDMNGTYVSFVYSSTGTNWKLLETPVGSLGNVSTSVTLTGLTKGTGNTLTNAVAGTDYQAPIGTISGIAKGNGTNLLTVATPGTDYLAPPTGTSLLKANSGGALSNAVAGTDYLAPSGALGTPTSGTLSSCTVDGTNAVGYKNIPQTGSDKTTAYTLTIGDVGKYVGVGTSGSIIVPTSTFANGDAISIYNNTTGNITITTSAPTAYIGGTNTVKTSITLATRGIATILFVSSTVCVVTGNVS